MSNVRQSGKLSSSYVQHEPVDLSFDEPSRTRQEFADECDINVLMWKFEATGVVSHVNNAEPQYVDYGDGVPDLREALDIVREANVAFMALPARVRAEFDNDPVKFVEFCGDPKNIGKLREWGLAAPEEAPPPPMKVEVVDPPKADKGAPQP